MMGYASAGAYHNHLQQAAQHARQHYAVGGGGSGGSGSFPHGYGYGGITDGSFEAAMQQQQQQNIWSGAALQQQPILSQLQNQQNYYKIIKGSTTMPFVQYEQPKVESTTIKKENKSMFKAAKEYFYEHRDLIMTTLFLIVVDQFVFDGVFKEKIKSLVDRIIGHAEGKVKALDSKK